MRPLLRRLLWILGIGTAFVLLALLGMGLASALLPTGTSRPEPEEVRPAPPRPAPVAERPPPPPPTPPAPPPQAVATPPPPPPTPPAEPEHPKEEVPALSTRERLRLRRELIKDVTALRDELARCPSQKMPVVPGGRAALVLEVVGAPDGLRVQSTGLRADVPVNEAFVACAKSVFANRTLAATNVPPGARARFFLPLAMGGAGLGLGSASLTNLDESQDP